MSVKLGIYDFFAYTIPGGIITTAIIFVVVNHFGFVIDVSKVSIFEFVVLVTLAYLMGYVNDFIARKTWYKIFHRKNLYETTIADLNKRNRAFDVVLNEIDWYIPFAFIKKKNLDMAQDIDKLNVQNIMLRNSSFGILVFAIIFGIEFFLNGYLLNYAIASVFCLVVSIILARESIKFASWFYQSIYQHLVALLVTSEQLPIKFVSKEKASKQKKK
jgi:hypothetical protein